MRVINYAPEFLSFQYMLNVLCYILLGDNRFFPSPIQILILSKESISLANCLLLIYLSFVGLGIEGNFDADHKLFHLPKPTHVKHFKMESRANKETKCKPREQIFQCINFFDDRVIQMSVSLSLSLMGCVKLVGCEKCGLQQYLFLKCPHHDS